MPRSEDFENVAQWLSGEANEDALVKFTTKLTKIYQEKMKKDAPFLTFVLIGVQSVGKSAITERFLSNVLNIVQTGTGTRCPLDITVIHDDECEEPSCDLYGEQLQSGGGDNISVAKVFQAICEHNQRLAARDTFSSKALHLTYRSRNVQNMRFADLPGIIENRSTGADRREAIKRILRSEMRKPNAKLCVLLEPKEFETNTIINFCDETLGGRDAWINDAVFLMTKFDKQIEDFRSASKANKFFKKFYENGIYPHLVITPTLPREDLPPDQLLEKRLELITGADTYEATTFRDWQQSQEHFRVLDHGGDESLDEEIMSKMGFSTAKAIMGTMMIENFVNLLPTVLRELRAELDKCWDEQAMLEEKLKFSDPNELRQIVVQLTSTLSRKMVGYLDGDMKIAYDFPHLRQTLADELAEEQRSDWCNKKLNHHTEKKEHVWRGKAASQASHPIHVQPDAHFTGGKQVHRAMLCHESMMIESLSNPSKLRECAANAAGYLQNNICLENWERVAVQVTSSFMKDITHPGINFVIKHIGCILRRLFSIALQDVKTGEALSSTFRLLPASAEFHLKTLYDNFLWKIMTDAGSQCNALSEAMYSTVDPKIPTFFAPLVHYKRMEDGEDKDQELESLLDGTREEMSAALGTTDQAIAHMKEKSAERIVQSVPFLSAERSSMINQTEIDDILEQSFNYILSLLRLLTTNLSFQLNYIVVDGFKRGLLENLTCEITKTDWSKLVKPENDALRQQKALEEKIQALQSTMHEVERMAADLTFSQSTLHIETRTSSYRGFSADDGDDLSI